MLSHSRQIQFVSISIRYKCGLAIKLGVTKIIQVHPTRQLGLSWEVTSTNYCLVLNQIGFGSEEIVRQLARTTPYIHGSRNGALIRVTQCIYPLGQRHRLGLGVRPTHDVENFCHINQPIVV